MTDNIHYAVARGECLPQVAAEVLSQGESNMQKLTEALTEIANRAGNFMDPDAAEWMPSIYKIACEAIGEDPGPIELRASVPAQGTKDYPSTEAMMAAVELEIQAALGRVQTVAIGRMIQKAIDASRCSAVGSVEATESREAIARMLVPYWCGGFERQEWDKHGNWEYPPGTPNARAYEIADKALAIVAARCCPAEKNRDLPNLWNAIVAATEGDGLFWVGEVLLDTIHRETGYHPSGKPHPAHSREEQR